MAAHRGDKKRSLVTLGEEGGPSSANDGVCERNAKVVKRRGAHGK